MLDGVMASSMCTLNYHSLFTYSQHRTNHISKSNAAAIAVKVSSVLLPTEESKNLPEPSKLMHSSINSKRSRSPAWLSRRDTVGIIGGVSAFSTLMFLEKLVWLGSRDGKECFPFIVCSDPALKGQLSMRTGLASATDVQMDRIQDAEVLENLRRKRVFLEQSGARCIVMPCHISHLWHNEVFQDCHVTSLHIGDCVAKELKEAKLKPLEAGSKVRIGVLTADVNLVGAFYQEKLQDQGFEVVLPDRPTMEHMVMPAIEALKHKDTEGARNLVRIAIQVLLVKAANRIILASDQFQGLLPINDPVIRKCIDPMDALARSTIKWTQSTEKTSPI